MDSMSDSLKATLPLNVEEDPELLDHFKDSAMSITTLFKYSQGSRKRAFAQGYNGAIVDLIEYVQTNVKDTERANKPPLTIGSIVSYLESRHQGLVRELEKAPSTSRPATSKQPQPNIPSSQVSTPAEKSQSPNPSSDRLSPAASDSTPTIAPPKKQKKVSNQQQPNSGSPPQEPSQSQSPTPPSPARPNASVTTTGRPIVVDFVWPPPADPLPAWSDIAFNPVGVVESIPAAMVPTTGSKRKREALVDVDLTQGGHGASKKKKGKSNQVHYQNLKEDRMDLEDDSGRDRKRVARR